MSNKDVTVEILPGASKDFQIKVNRGNLNFTIVFLTTIIFAGLLLIIILVCFYSYNETTPKIDYQGVDYTNEKTMFPLITSQEQCLTIPNSIWTNFGCNCQYPYTGPFCRDEVIPSQGFTGISSTTFGVNAKILNTVRTSEIKCRNLCQNATMCKGYHFDSGYCTFFENISAQPNGGNLTIYLKT